MRGPFPEAEQERLSRLRGRAVRRDAGSSFRLDRTVHPFCSSFATTDIRLTTRYAETDLHSLFSSMHECGHGLYEHGVDPALERTLLCNGVSSALHESQSRLWENVVGRSAPFWRWLYPELEAPSPTCSATSPTMSSTGAVNRVQPSFIRVDADEVTYGLHVIIRFELEQELIVGSGLHRGASRGVECPLRRVPRRRGAGNDVGVLQDIHWAFNGFGYFPTYQLGNVIAAQIWQRVDRGVARRRGADRGRRVR